MRKGLNGDVVHKVESVPFHDKGEFAFYQEKVHIDANPFVERTTKGSKIDSQHADGHSNRLCCEINISSHLGLVTSVSCSREGR